MQLKYPIIVAALALAGTVPNTSAGRDCSDARVPVCAAEPLPAGTVIAPVRETGRVVGPRAAAPEPSAAERLEAEQQRLEEEQRKVELQRLQTEERQAREAARNLDEIRRRRITSQSESELGLAKSRSERGLDRSDSELNR